MPYLEHDGVTRELPQGETLVGSGSEVSWRLQTINLALRHFTVHVDSSGSTVLTPCRSHDVDVNGTPITGPRALAHGDEIIAGAGIFAFLESLAPAQNAAAPPAAAYLIDIGAGLAYPLTEDAVTIGRDPVNQVAVRNPAVSRFHAEIRTTPDRRGFVFRSTGAGGSSVNGTLVGTSPRPLVEGDLVRIAGTTLRFTTSAPPSILRIVARSEVTASVRTRQSAAIQRAVESPTAGSMDVRGQTEIGGGVSSRGRWITGALVVTGGLLLWLVLRGPHSH